MPRRWQVNGEWQDQAADNNPRSTSRGRTRICLDYLNDPRYLPGYLTSTSPSLEYFENSSSRYRSSPRRPSPQAPRRRTRKMNDSASRGRSRSRSPERLTSGRHSKRAREDRGYCRANKADQLPSPSTVPVSENASSQYNGDDEASELVVTSATPTSSRSARGRKTRGRSRGRARGRGKMSSSLPAGRVGELAKRAGRKAQSAGASRQTTSTASRQAGGESAGSVHDAFNRDWDYEQRERSIDFAKSLLDGIKNNGDQTGQHEYLGVSIPADEEHSGNVTPARDDFSGHVNPHETLGLKKQCTLSSDSRRLLDKYGPVYYELQYGCSAYSDTRNNGEAGSARNQSSTSGGEDSMSSSSDDPSEDSNSHCVTDTAITVQDDDPNRSENPHVEEITPQSNSSDIVSHESVEGEERLGGDGFQTDGTIAMGRAGQAISPGSASMNMSSEAYDASRVVPVPSGAHLAAPSTSGSQPYRMSIAYLTNARDQTPFLDESTSHSFIDQASSAAKIITRHSEVANTILEDHSEQGQAGTVDRTDILQTMSQTGSGAFSSKSRSRFGTAENHSDREEDHDLERQMSYYTASVQVPQDGHETASTPRYVPDYFEAEYTHQGTHQSQTSRGYEVFHHASSVSHDQDSISDNGYGNGLWRRADRNDCYDDNYPFRSRSRSRREEFGNLTPSPSDCEEEDATGAEISHASRQQLVPETRRQDRDNQQFYFNDHNLDEGGSVILSVYDTAQSRDTLHAVLPHKAREIAARINVLMGANGIESIRATTLRGRPVIKILTKRDRRDFVLLRNQWLDVLRNRPYNIMTHHVWDRDVFFLLHVKVPPFVTIASDIDTRKSLLREIKDTNAHLGATVDPFWVNERTFGLGFYSEAEYPSAVDMLAPAEDGRQVILQLTDFAYLPPRM